MNVFSSLLHHAPYKYSDIRRASSQHRLYHGDHYIYKKGYDADVIDGI